MALFKRKSLDQQKTELEAKKKQAEMKVQNANIKKDIRKANQEAFAESNIGRVTSQVKETLKKKREQNKMKQMPGESSPKKAQNNVNQTPKESSPKKSQLDINNREKQDNFIKNFRL